MRMRLSPRDLVERAPLAGEAPVDPVEARFGGGVDEEPGQQVGEAVAGLAVHRPVAGQLLVLGEDLLHHDPAPREKPREPLEILPRIGEAVGMVDAHAVDAAAPREARRECMRGREHVRVLGPAGRRGR